VFDECDVALGITLLLEPRQAPAVRVQGGDNIVKAVAIDIVDSPSRCPPKMPRVYLANAVGWYFQLSGLLPGAGCSTSRRIENIQTAIPIDIAHPDSMCRRIALLRDVMNDPLAGGIAGIGLGVTDIPFAA